MSGDSGPLPASDVIHHKQLLFFLSFSIYPFSGCSNLELTAPSYTRRMSSLNSGLTVSNGDRSCTRAANRLQRGNAGRERERFRRGSDQTPSPTRPGGELLTGRKRPPREEGGREEGEAGRGRGRRAGGRKKEKKKKRWWKV